MFEVTLTKEGGFSCYIDFFQSLDSAEEILIDGCCRCVGLIILWEKRDDCPKHMWASQYASSSFHIPPYFKNAKSSRSQFFGLINYLKRGYEPRCLFYCGGKVDTVQNKTHYERSKNFFILPLQKLFPNMTVEGLDPVPTQASSSIFMNEDLDIVFERFDYATDQ